MPDYSSVETFPDLKFNTLCPSASLRLCLPSRFRSGVSCSTYTDVDPIGTSKIVQATSGPREAQKIGLLSKD